MAVDFTRYDVKALYQTLKENYRVKEKMMNAKSFKEIQTLINKMGVAYTQDQMDYFQNVWESHNVVQ